MMTVRNLLIALLGNQEVDLDTSVVFDPGEPTGDDGEGADTELPTKERGVMLPPGKIAIASITIDGNEVTLNAAE